MIKLSTKGDYALKAIIFLIRNNDRKVRIEEISNEENMSESLLRRIIADLEKSGIIITYKGRNGGIHLNENLKEISIYDILLAVGEELGISECSKGNKCENSDACSTFPLYSDLQKGLNGILKLYTLDKLKKES